MIGSMDDTIPARPAAPDAALTPSRAARVASGPRPTVAVDASTAARIPACVAPPAPAAARPARAAASPCIPNIDPSALSTLAPPARAPRNAAARPPNAAIEPIAAFINPNRAVNATTDCTSCVDIIKFSACNATPNATACAAPFRNGAGSSLNNRTADVNVTASVSISFISVPSGARIPDRANCTPSSTSR